LINSVSSAFLRACNTSSPDFGKLVCFLFQLRQGHGGDGIIGGVTFADGGNAGWHLHAIVKDQVTRVILDRVALVIGLHRTDFQGGP